MRPSYVPLHPSCYVTKHFPALEMQAVDGASWPLAESAHLRAHTSRLHHSALSGAGEDHAMDSLPNRSGIINLSRLRTHTDKCKCLVYVDLVVLTI